MKHLLLFCLRIKKLPNGSHLARIEIYEIVLTFMLIVCTTFPFWFLYSKTTLSFEAYLLVETLWSYTCHVILMTHTHKAVIYMYIHRIVY